MDDAETTYDLHGEAYRSWWAPIIRPSALRLLDRVDSPMPASGGLDVVDVGTGTGTLALSALERWPEAAVTGVDVSRVMLRMAGDDALSRGDGFAARARWLLGGADRLPLPDASADLVVSSFVIQLVPSRTDALREVLRVLRPGGLAAILTWQDDDEPFEPEELVWDAFEDLEIDVPDEGGDRHPYASPAAAAAELRRIGFRDTRARRDWLEHPFTPQSYLDVVEHWIEDDVFSALDEARRRALRSLILGKLERLSAEELVWRRPLVSVLARRP